MIAGYPRLQPRHRPHLARRRGAGIRHRRHQRRHHLDRDRPLRRHEGKRYRPRRLEIRHRGIPRSQIPLHGRYRPLKVSHETYGQDRTGHVMTKDQVKSVLKRVPTWPEDRQQVLAEVALEIEAELAGAGYDATPDELVAIDEGVTGEAASEKEVEAAFAAFRRT